LPFLTAITTGENFGTDEKNSYISGDWNTVPSGVHDDSDQAPCDLRRFGEEGESQVRI